MARAVIAVYRPKPGKEQQLMAVLGKHWPVLRREQLVTDRPAQVLRAADGTMLEVFEWQSADAIQRAHANPAVQAIWAEFGAASDFQPLASLPEAQEMFAEFDAVAVPAPSAMREG